MFDEFIKDCNTFLQQGGSLDEHIGRLSVGLSQIPNLGISANATLAILLNALSKVSNQPSILQLTDKDLASLLELKDYLALYELTSHTRFSKLLLIIQKLLSGSRLQDTLKEIFPYTREKDRELGFHRNLAFLALHSDATQDNIPPLVRKILSAAFIELTSIINKDNTSNKRETDNTGAEESAAEEAGAAAASSHATDFSDENVSLFRPKLPADSSFVAYDPTFSANLLSITQEWLTKPSQPIRQEVNRDSQGEIDNYIRDLRQVLNNPRCLKFTQAAENIIRPSFSIDVLKEQVANEPDFFLTKHVCIIEPNHLRVLFDQYSHDIASKTIEVSLLQLALLANNTAAISLLLKANPEQVFQDFLINERPRSPTSDRSKTHRSIFLYAKSAHSLQTLICQAYISSKTSFEFLNLFSMILQQRDEHKNTLFCRVFENIPNWPIQERVILARIFASFIQKSDFFNTETVNDPFASILLEHAASNTEEELKPCIMQLLRYAERNSLNATSASEVLKDDLATINSSPAAEPSLEITLFKSEHQVVQALPLKEFVKKHRVYKQSSTMVLNIHSPIASALLKGNNDLVLETINVFPQIFNVTNHDGLSPIECFVFEAFKKLLTLNIAERGKYREFIKQQIIFIRGLISSDPQKILDSIRDNVCASAACTSQYFESREFWHSTTFYQGSKKQADITPQYMRDYYEEVHRLFAELKGGIDALALATRTELSIPLLLLQNYMSEKFGHSQPCIYGSDGINRLSVKGITALLSLDLSSYNESQLGILKFIVFLLLRTKTLVFHDGKIDPKDNEILNYYRQLNPSEFLSLIKFIQQRFANAFLPEKSNYQQLPIMSIPAFCRVLEIARYNVAPGNLEELINWKDPLNPLAVILNRYTAHFFGDIPLATFKEFDSNSNFVIGNIPEEKAMQAVIEGNQRHLLAAFKTFDKQQSSSPNSSNTFLGGLLSLFWSTPTKQLAAPDQPVNSTKEAVMEIKGK